MKTLTKLLTATTLTIGLFSNAAYADSIICEKNSDFITNTYTTTAGIVKDGLLDKSGAIDLLRYDLIKELKRQFKGNELEVGLIMGNHALDYVDENFEQMKRMSINEIKRIGYKNCDDIESIVLEQYQY